MASVSSWGGLSHFDHEVIMLDDRDRLRSQIQNQNKGIVYGMGRSYGDVCLNPHGPLWKTNCLDRFIHFNQKSGRLICEPGVLLKDIQNIALLSGWMLPVTPGTQFVTLGGAVANDVHGKNHHRLGNFGDHIISLKLLRTDNTWIKCGPHSNVKWFYATTGGLGLTGIITEIEIQLRKVPGPWLDVETIAYSTIDDFFMLADESEAQFEYTVSWVDCLSKANQLRGIFMRANHSTQKTPYVHNKHHRAPFTPPFSLVNRLTLKPLNRAYFYMNKLKQNKSIMGYEQFFYPLDNLLEWNRLYGSKGFYQYQSVVPYKYRKDATQAMMKEIYASHEGSFLAVLKTFGKKISSGMLSFPMPGVTLALDFPNRGESTLKLLNRLDSIIREAKGRIYCAKDARMPKDLFELGYPRLNEFIKYRDPGISSALSRRLMGN